MNDFAADVRQGSLAPGLKIGQYVVCSFLGAGGMGEVYRATDQRLGRDVALKILPEAYGGSAERVERFEFEARTTGKLNHPNIVSIFDTGEHEGRPYMVAELLEGQTLWTQLRQSQPMPLRKVLEISIQIARGLAAAHEKNIVHRDLKPANIFISRDGHVKILDFGLAKLTQAQNEQPNTDGDTVTGPATAAGRVMGSAGYMSPEQVEARAVDARSDIFSFGAILYEMLAGNRAFRGDSMAATMSAILRDDPPDLLSVRPDIPPGLGQIVRRCLQKSAKERFQSARDLAFNLEGLVPLPLSSPSGSAGSAVPSPPARRRNRVFARLPLAVVALLVVIAGAVAAAIVANSRRDVPRSDDQMRVTRLTRLGNVFTGRMTADRKMLIYVLDHPDGSEIRLRHMSSGTEITIVETARYHRAGLTIAPREDFLYYMEQAHPRIRSIVRVPLLGGVPQTVVSGMDVGAYALSPDGRTLAWVDWMPFGDTRIHVVPSSGGTARVLTTLPGVSFINDLLWHRDGSGLITTSGSENFSATPELIEVTYPDGNFRRLPLPERERPTYLSWVPERDAIVAFTEARDIIEISWPGRQVMALARGTQYAGITAVDGSALTAAIGRHDFNLWVVDTRTAEATRISLAPELPEGREGVCWTADEQIIFTVPDQERGSTALWRAQEDGSGRQQVTFPAEQARDVMPNASRDGKSIVFVRAHRASGEHQLLRLDAGAQDPIVIHRSSRPLVNPQFTPDSRSILFVDEPLGEDGIVMRIPADGGKPQPFRQGCVLQSIDPSGRLMVCSDRNGREAVFPLSGGAAIWEGDLSTSQVVWNDRGELIFASGALGGEAYKVSNLYAQPINGSAPVQLTKFTTDEIPALAASHDGTRIVMRRGRQIRDLVLLENVPYRTPPL